MSSDSADPNEFLAMEKLEAELKSKGYSASAEVRTVRRSDGQPMRMPLLRVDWPSGKTTRTITFDSNSISALSKIRYENFHLLADLEAMVNTTTGEIETRISPLIRNVPGGLRGRDPSEIPGVEKLNPDAFPIAGESDPWDSNEPWRLHVTNGPVAIEISPASQEFLTMFGIRFQGPVTLKITGLTTRDHDGALSALQTYGRSFMMDLDLRYGIAWGVTERRAPSRRATIIPLGDAPSFPSNRYPAEPLALYTYARSAWGLPLLEYLAYYQAVEYFFPVISQEETVKSVRAAVRDPRFNPANDAAIRRVISLATPGGFRGRMTEREQLRLTVRAVVTDQAIRQFLETTPHIQEHLCGKAQVIKGVERLQLQNAQLDLRDQVADRIYAIRCRIVHTKDDGGDSGVDLLLPSSREAQSLGPDVDLVRLVAELVLIDRAEPMR